MQRLWKLLCCANELSIEEFEMVVSTWEAVGFITLPSSSPALSACAEGVQHPTWDVARYTQQDGSAGQRLNKGRLLLMKRQ